MSIHVKSTIDGQIANTVIEQEFYNPNARPIEGSFLFPIPKGAQISRFSMEIGGKSAEAELLSAEKARKIYEDIVRSMKDPALLEYAGRELYKVRIFPIDAHSRKKVTVAYTEVLRNSAGLSEYVLPLNTARYSSKPLRNISLEIGLNSKTELKSIYSASHSVEIKRVSATRAKVAYESSDPGAARDFHLAFAEEKGEIGVHLLSHREGSEGFFLLLASPGLPDGAGKVTPKDVAFVLDTSGSMAGAKLEQAKKALLFCVENLNDEDRFEVIRFSSDAELLFSKLSDASDENRKQAARFIRELKPIGGTAIDEALRRAVMLRPDTGERPFVIIFLTDGLPTVGTRDEGEIVKTVTGNASKSTRVFCFGIGTDVNTHLLDTIADRTRAFTQYVLADEDIEVKVSTFYSKINEPVLANPRIAIDGDVRVSSLYPTDLPDLFKGDQLVLAGRYSGTGAARVRLEGVMNQSKRAFEYQVQFPERSVEHDFIPRLWATRRVGFLLDEIRLRGENPELRDEITELARRYGIVTPFTAYLITEDEARRNVPVTSQSLPGLSRDRETRDRFGAAYRNLQEERSGEAAVLNSRSGVFLKQADNATDALAFGNAAVARGITATSRPALAGRAAGRVSAPAIVDATATQSQFVNGRTFYQNGSAWVDANVQKLPTASRQRIQFNSPEYFALARRHPEALPWLALGQNVHLLLGDTVYEIHE